MSTIPIISSAADLPGAIRHAEKQTGARWYVAKRAAALGVEDRIPQSWGVTAAFGGDWTPPAREKAEKKGEAMPGGAFPIKDEADLDRAIQAHGRAKSKHAAKKHIKKRAKALGLEHKLPDDWKDAQTASATSLPPSQEASKIDGMPIVAAGWSPDLHPRDRGGRWIEKFDLIDVFGVSQGTSVIMRGRAVGNGKDSSGKDYIDVEVTHGDFSTDTSGLQKGQTVRVPVDRVKSSPPEKARLDGGTLSDPSGDRRAERKADPSMRSNRPSPSPESESTHRERDVIAMHPEAYSKAADDGRHALGGDNYEVEYDAASGASGTPYILRPVSNAGKGDAGHFATADEANAAMYGRIDGKATWNVMGQKVRERGDNPSLAESNTMWDDAKKALLEGKSPDEAATLAVGPKVDSPAPDPGEVPGVTRPKTGDELATDPTLGPQDQMAVGNYPEGGTPGGSPKVDTVPATTRLDWQSDGDNLRGFATELGDAGGIPTDRLQDLRTDSQAIDQAMVGGRSDELRTAYEAADLSLANLQDEVSGDSELESKLEDHHQMIQDRLDTIGGASPNAFSDVKATEKAVLDGHADADPGTEAYLNAPTKEQGKLDAMSAPDAASPATDDEMRSFLVSKGYGQDVVDELHGEELRSDYEAESGPNVPQPGQVTSEPLHPQDKHNMQQFLINEKGYDQDVVDSLTDEELRGDFEAEGGHEDLSATPTVKIGEEPTTQDIQPPDGMRAAWEAEIRDGVKKLSDEELANSIAANEKLNLSPTSPWNRAIEIMKEMQQERGGGGSSDPGGFQTDLDELTAPEHADYFANDDSEYNRIVDRMEELGHSREQTTQALNDWINSGDTTPDLMDNVDHLRDIGRDINEGDPASVESGGILANPGAANDEDQTALSPQALDSFRPLRDLLNVDSGYGSAFSGMSDDQLSQLQDYADSWLEDPESVPPWADEALQGAEQFRADHNLNDIADVIQLRQDLSRLGWAQEEQLTNILNGEPLGDQNSAALANVANVLAQHRTVSFDREDPEALSASDLADAIRVYQSTDLRPPQAPGGPDAGDPREDYWNGYSTGPFQDLTPEDQQALRKQYDDLVNSGTEPLAALDQLQNPRDAANDRAAKARAEADGSGPEAYIEGMTRSAKQLGLSDNKIQRMTDAFRSGYDEQGPNLGLERAQAERDKADAPSSTSGFQVGHSGDALQDRGELYSDPKLGESWRIHDKDGNVVQDGIVSDSDAEFIAKEQVASEGGPDAPSAPAPDTPATQAEAVQENDAFKKIRTMSKIANNKQGLNVSEAGVDAELDDVLRTDDRDEAHRKMATIMTRLKLGGKQRKRYRGLLDAHRGDGGGDDSANVEAAATADELSPNNPVKDRLAKKAAEAPSTAPLSGQRPASFITDETFATSDAQAEETARRNRAKKAAESAGPDAKGQVLVPTPMGDTWMAANTPGIDPAEVKDTRSIDDKGNPVPSTPTPRGPSGSRKADDLKEGDTYRRGDRVYRLRKDPVLTRDEVHLSGESADGESDSYIVKKGTTLDPGEAPAQSKPGPDAGVPNPPGDPSTWNDSTLRQMATNGNAAQQITAQRELDRRKSGEMSDAMDKVGERVPGAQQTASPDLPDHIKSVVSPGDKVYAHPQGSHIVVSPDGSVQKYGPNGETRSTSADAAKLALGHGKWTPVDTGDSGAPSAPSMTPDEVARRLQETAGSKQLRAEAIHDIENAGAGHLIPDDGNTIRVANRAQKILLEQELQGQISDGFWENSGPNDHWQDWSGATVIVDPQNIGINFRPRKNNYALDNKDLLGMVGDRMVEAVQEGAGHEGDGDPNYNMAKMRADLRRLKIAFKTNRENHDGGGGDAMAGTPDLLRRYKEGQTQTPRPDFPKGLQAPDRPPAKRTAKKAAPSSPEPDRPAYPTTETGFPKLSRTDIEGIAGEFAGNRRPGLRNQMRVFLEEQSKGISMNVTRRNNAQRYLHDHGVDTMRVQQRAHDRAQKSFDRQGGGGAAPLAKAPAAPAAPAAPKVAPSKPVAIDQAPADIQAFVADQDSRDWGPSGNPYRRDDYLKINNPEGVWEGPATTQPGISNGFGPSMDTNPDSPWEGTRTVQHGYYGMSMQMPDGRTVRSEAPGYTGADNGRGLIIDGLSSWAVEFAGDEQNANRIWAQRGPISKIVKDHGGHARVAVVFNDDGTMTVSDYDYHRWSETVPIDEAGKA